MELSDLLAAPWAWLVASWTSIVFAILSLVIGWIVAGAVYRLIGRMLPQRYGVSRNFAPHPIRDTSRDGQTPDRMMVRPHETTKGETFMKRQCKYLFVPDMAGFAHQGSASW